LKVSGLTAEQSASERGTKAKTLQFWKYKLAKATPCATLEGAADRDRTALDRDAAGLC
jgi:hypothetical protein